MSKKIENLRDLFIVQGREFYDASKQEESELPKIQKHTKNQKLNQILDSQLNMAKNQKIRIQQALKKMNVSPEGEKNESCETSIKHTKSMIARSKDPEVRDAAIINSIQRLNHTKIASLGALSSYARQLGHEDIANSFHETLNEEKAIDKKLSDIAINEINKKALTAIAS
jgi:ferritin-like metal-binding protein YciE